MTVADEQAANQRYLREMQRKVERSIPIAVARSSLWTGSGLPVPTAPVVGPLVGRVGLAGHDSAVGATNFYIGPWHFDGDALVVFSWAAPVAATFYESENSTFELEHHVVVRRTLSIRQPGSEVSEYFDDLLVELSGDSPFVSVRGLSIPAPPRPSNPSASFSHDSEAETGHSQAPAEHPQPGQGRPASSGQRVRQLRAESAVRAALTAPRGSALPSLLATLQPDQYDFVTRPIDAPLVVQGHPGTGKTVIAAHRAAYLVHPERTGGARAPRVLLLGPNQFYADHVAGVLKSLTIQNPVSVMGIGDFLSRIRRLAVKLEGPMDGEHFEVSIDMGDLVDAAAHELRISGQLLSAENEQEAMRMVYEAVRSNHVGGMLLSDDADWVRDLSRLPPFNAATASRGLMPLLAQCALSATPMPNFLFDHVIVDEAQDVRPLEWRLIRAVNPSGSWTLLGDMNQRRSDWSYHSWVHLVRDLHLVGEGEPFEPVVFKRGYRSTGPIMAFANQLLPREQRTAENIQAEGPEPKVTRVQAKLLNQCVIDAAIDLHARHSPGTVAVIVVNRSPIGKALTKAGWTLDAADKRKLMKGTHQVYLLTPELARGLEFDAVVVVEPNEFPPNLGRMGSLYTSLTRANRELAVIYSTQLPDGLRARRESKKQLN